LRSYLKARILPLEMAKTTEKKYADKPRYKVIEQYEQSFINRFNSLCQLMNKEIITTVNNFVNDGRSTKSDSTQK
jgi:hypothetical protein